MSRCHILQFEIILTDQLNTVAQLTFTNESLKHHFPTRQLGESVVIFMVFIHVLIFKQELLLFQHLLSYFCVENVVIEKLSGINAKEYH